MQTYPLRVRFIDADHAYEYFHSFPPDDIDYLNDYSRKRAGDSQMILLRLEDGSQLESFLHLCKEHPAIVEVISISEEEFWKAPSNAI
jgi:hypothetical protein